MTSKLMNNLFKLQLNLLSITFLVRKFNLIQLNKISLFAYWSHNTESIVRCCQFKSIMQSLIGYVRSQTVMLVFYDSLRLSIN